jgi:hypothetical protein
MLSLFQPDVFTSRSLATASNSRDPSASCTQTLSFRTACRLFLQLNWTPPPLAHNTARLKSYVTTDGQSASMSWCEAPIWDLRPDFFFCLTVAVLLMWGALSDERTGLFFNNVQYIYILQA